MHSANIETQALPALLLHYTCVKLFTLPPSVYANVDVKAQKSTTVSKTMFATHVNEMHCNRGEGFEREFEVSMYVCVRVCVNGEYAHTQPQCYVHSKYLLSFVIL